MVNGALINFTLADTLGRATVSGLGVVGAGNFQGALTGSLVFAGGQVCEVQQATFEVTLEPKPSP